MLTLLHGEKKRPPLTSGLNETSGHVTVGRWWWWRFTSGEYNSDYSSIETDTRTERRTNELSRVNRRHLKYFAPKGHFQTETGVRPRGMLGKPQGLTSTNCLTVNVEGWGSVFITELSEGGGGGLTTENIQRSVRDTRCLSRCSAALIRGLLPEYQITSYNKRMKNTDLWQKNRGQICIWS